MDEVRQLCGRLVGEPAAGAAAEEAGGAAAGRDRTARLQAALVACRRHESAAAGPPAPAAEGPRLASAVAGELRAAAAGLDRAQREALALRDLLGLSYAEIAAVTGASPEAVAECLAAGRLALRDRLRGGVAPQPECVERRRALQTIAARQDGQPLPAADDDWLIEHLGHCRGCAQAHAGMLEAAACYRAWAAAEAGGGRTGADEPDDASATTGARA